RPLPPCSTLFPYTTLFRSADDTRRLRGFQLLSAKPLLLVINLDEADIPEIGASVERAAAATGLDGFLSAASTRAVPVCAKIELRSEEHTSELQSRENLVCR